MYAANGSVLPPIFMNTYGSLTVPAYWRAVNFLAENLASFPRFVRRGDSQDAEHQLNRLLKHKPNGYQNGFTLWRSWFFHAAHTGNAYMLVERGADQEPIGLHLLACDQVMPFRYAEAGQPLQGYFVDRSTKAVYRSADVLHLQGLSWDGIRGLDVQCLHQQTFETAATITRYQVRFLSKGTVVRGSIEIPGAIDDERLEQMRAVLQRHFQGADAERDVLLLTDGAKLNNTTLSPKDSELTAQLGATTKSIAQVTGVPPEFLFELSEAKYNASVEQAGQTVVRYTFRPWIEQIEDELSLKLLSEEDQAAGLTVRLNPDALLRGDSQVQTTTLATQVTAGIRTRNEARAQLELPPSDDPNANVLKVSGDTSPQTAAPAAPAAPAR